MAKQNVSKTRTSSNNKKVVHKTKKKNRNASKVLSVVFLLAIVIAGTYLLCTHQTFNIIAFHIEGTEKYTTEQITEKLNIDLGKNIFLEVITSDKEKVAEFPYIETLKFDFHLPNVLNFKVVERELKYFAYDKEKNVFFRLDENGYILEECKIENKTAEELLVYGITFDNEVILGDKINEIDMSKIVVFLEIKEAFESSNINRNITKVNFENSLTTLTLNDKLNVIFPNNENLKYKLALLSEILKSLGEDAVGVIDLTKTDPTYSSF